ncbi:MAG: cellulase family glycosylhydrolase [Chlorobi bacterium]|nr:cellulase family glycosylhydrolase [Chlorobiota bacterium]
MQVKYELRVLFALLVIPLTSLTQPISDGYIFTIPFNDTLHNTFIPAFKGSVIGRVQSSGDKFVIGNSQVRFIGVNLTEGANFPRKEDAPIVARRLRQLGINMVRLHQMDNYWTGPEGNIFLNKDSSTIELNPEMVDRLHYFISHLKENGIYVNINLHTNRVFVVNDGIPDADSIHGHKAYTLFDPIAIRLQKDYARRLLTVVNPYTGLSLAEDPVVASVEITNENGIYQYWRYDALRHFSEGGILTHRQTLILDSLWINFLTEKYGNDSVLRMAWCPRQPVMGPNIIINGSFESQNPFLGWALEQHYGASATLSIDSSTSVSGNNSLKLIIVNSTGVDWHLQFVQRNLSFHKDSLYVLTFYAKSDSTRWIKASIAQAIPPYRSYGTENIQLDTIWKRYEVWAVPLHSLNNQGRITFSLGHTQGIIWFDSIVLRQRSKFSLHNDESLFNGTIKRIKYSHRLAYCPQRTMDMGEFYLFLQRQFYEDMKKYLEDSLSVEALIVGSNDMRGLFEPWTFQNMDYIDEHAYWDHPYFPSIPWSIYDWYIRNWSLIEQEALDVIPRRLTGGLALANKPYVVSEYMHCFPNRFQSEMLPIIVGMLAFHGADGLLFFNYLNGDPPDWQTDKIPNWFSIYRNTSIIAQLPAFAFAFRNNLINQNSTPTLVYYDSSFILRLPLMDTVMPWEVFYPYDYRSGLHNTILTADFNAPVPSISVPAYSGDFFVSSSGEIVWDRYNSYFLIDAPQFFALSTPKAQKLAIPSQMVDSISTDGHTTISLLSLDSNPIVKSSKLLLTVTTTTQNSNMIWDGTTTVHNDWGTEPTINEKRKLIMYIKLNADSIKVYPLNSRGIPFDSFTLFPSRSTFKLEIDQGIFPTPWFGIKSFGVPSDIFKDISHAEVKCQQIGPDEIVITGDEPIDVEGLNLTTLTGKALSSYNTAIYKFHNKIIVKLSSNLPNGFYILSTPKDKCLITKMP